MVYRVEQLYFNIVSYGAVNGGGDCSGAVNAAIAAAVAAGGGAVWVPAGLWRLEHQVVLLSGVSLQGGGNGWQYVAGTPLGAGSVFDVEWGNNGAGSSNDHNQAAILVQSTTTIDHIGFDYKSQSGNSNPPVEYGATIMCYDTAHGGVNLNITNNAFNRAYVAIDCRGSNQGLGVGGVTIADNMGCPAFFLKINWVVDWVNIRDNTSNGGLCSSSPTIGMSSWVASNGIVYWIGHQDDMTIQHAQAAGYGTGVSVDYTTSEYSGDGRLLLVDSEFDATQYGVVYADNSASTSLGIVNLSVVNCHFAPFNNATQASGAAILIQNSTKVGTLSLTGNDIYNYSTATVAYFLYASQTTISLGNVIITGNSSKGNPQTVPPLQFGTPVIASLICTGNAWTGYSSTISTYNAAFSSVSGNTHN